MSFNASYDVFMTSKWTVTVTYALTYRLTELLGRVCVVEALSDVMHDVRTPDVMTLDVGEQQRRITTSLGVTQR